MSDTKYNPGAVVTVGDLEVGDTVFLKLRPSQEGLPHPTHPAVVTSVEPAINGTVLVHVRNVGSASTVEPRALGYLPVTREFHLAVPVA